MLPKFDFMTALKFVSHAMAKFDKRTYLTGALLRFEGRDLTFVASDGHRVARVKLTVADHGEFWPQGDYIIEAASVKAVLSTFKTKKTDTTELHIEKRPGHDGKPGLFAFDAVSRLELKLAAGTYPDFDRAMPQREPEGAPLVGLNVEYLAEAAAALKPLSNPKYRGAKLETWDGMTGIRLTAATNHGDFKTITEPALVYVMYMRL